MLLGLGHAIRASFVTVRLEYGLDNIKMLEY